MRQSDLEWIKDVIRRSGIATKVQREAICQRIQDRFIERTEENRGSV